MEQIRKTRASLHRSISDGCFKLAAQAVTQNASAKPTNRPQNGCQATTVERCWDLIGRSGRSGDVDHADVANRTRSLTAAAAATVEQAHGSSVVEFDVTRQAKQVLLTGKL
jgi:hypothetical protein